MIKEITITEVKNKLKEWGLLYEDHGMSYSDAENIWVQYESDGQMMCSTDEEIMDAETVGELIDTAEWYSCCGDVLDHDVPMCPSCKEWC